MKWLLVVFFRFQEFSPNSDLNSSFGSVPRRPNLSTQVNDCVDGKPRFDLDGIEFVTPDGDGNFWAMQVLKAGDADVLWVYAEQAEDCMADLTAEGCRGERPQAARSC